MRGIPSVLRKFKFCFETIRDNHGALVLRVPPNIQRSTFESKLTSLIDQQIVHKSKAFWVFLDNNNISLVDIALKYGFKIHHGKDASIVLYRWLHQTPDLVPGFSRFYIAAGGIVIQEGKLLMVQQANGNRKDDWGIPGGLAQMNQTLQDATQRQVKEQTNLAVKFKYMVFFRELSNTLFDGTDFYFANYVKLRDGSSLDDLKLCERQLQGHKWVDLTKADQFMGTHQVKNTQRHLLTYLAQLQSSGFKFDQQEPNSHSNHTLQVGKITKQFREHRLVPINP